MVTEIEDYFSKGCGRCARFETPDCATRIWSEGLLLLRGLCRDSGAEETLKWGHPCYVHAGRNIAIIGAFRSDFRLSFFDAALLRDPDAMLERQGPNTAHADMIRFRGTKDVTVRADTIASYLQEMMDYAVCGIRPEKQVQDLDLPEELTMALAADPLLADAFAALTPGRRKSYVINLNGAKASETRTRRIANFRPKILAGKGAQER